MKILIKANFTDKELMPPRFKISSRLIQEWCDKFKPVIEKALIKNLMIGGVMKEILY